MKVDLHLTNSRKSILVKTYYFQKTTTKCTYSHACNNVYGSVLNIGRMEMDVLYLPRDVLELIPRFYGPCNPIVSKIRKKGEIFKERSILWPMQHLNLSLLFYFCTIFQFFQIIVVQYTYLIDRQYPLTLAYGYNLKLIRVSPKVRTESLPFQESR